MTCVPLDCNRMELLLGMLRIVNLPMANSSPII